MDLWGAEMPLIKGIRVYRSNIENIDGNSLPEGFANKQLDCVLQRITMKLRENGFTLGDFDHLYINLTTCSIPEGLALSKRGKDAYHPWYRYYDVEISNDLYNSLETQESIPSIIDIVEHTLQLFFSDLQNSSELIQTSISEAVTKGERMEMLFKSKTSSKRKAIIYLRFMDTAQFFPLLKVYDADDNLIFQKDLPKAHDLNAYGEIQLNNNSITIKPRKNAFTKHLHPMKLTF